MRAKRRILAEVEAEGTEEVRMELSKAYRRLRTAVILAAGEHRGLQTVVRLRTIDMEEDTARGPGGLAEDEAEGVVGRKTALALVEVMLAARHPVWVPLTSLL